MNGKEGVMTEPAEPRYNPMKLVGLVITRLPSLLLRSGGELLRFRAKARKAARIFHDELCRQGMDPDSAEHLTQFYLDGSNPFVLLRARRAFR
jgi:hypothetical protein